MTARGELRIRIDRIHSPRRLTLSALLIVAIDQNDTATWALPPVCGLTARPFNEGNASLILLINHIVARERLLAAPGT